MSHCLEKPTLWNDSPYMLSRVRILQTQLFCNANDLVGLQL